MSDHGIVTVAIIPLIDGIVVVTFFGSKLTSFEVVTPAMNSSAGETVTGALLLVTSEAMFTSPTGD